jgi:hypothetical protein
MRAHGYLKPVVVGEHGGPAVFEFPQLDAVLQETLASAFVDPPATQSTEELVARAAQETPERRAMAALYARLPDLPPRLQMLMAGCPPELEAKRHRISSRQVVTRTVLALAEGVRRTAYWNLAPEIPGASDPYQMMHLVSGKLPLLDYEDGALRHRYPAADAFALLADQLAGVLAVTRLDTADRPALFAFRVDRADRGPLLVVWQHRDTFDGEDEPPVTVSLPWSAPAATAVDTFGAPHPVAVDDGRLRIDVSDTPIFLSAILDDR